MGLWFLGYSMMACSSSAALLKGLGQMQLCVIAAKKHPILLSREVEVGVKCRRKCGCIESQRFTYSDRIGETICRRDGHAFGKAL